MYAPVDVLQEFGGLRSEAHRELRDLILLHRMQRRRVAGVDVPEEDLTALSMLRTGR